MSFIVAGCALLVAVLVSVLLNVTDVERQQKARGDCLILGHFDPKAPLRGSVEYRAPRQTDPLTTPGTDPL
jgi:hypothetical protein